MASYSTSEGVLARKTLAANTVDTVTVTAATSGIPAILRHHGPGAPVYYSTDGTTPVVGASDFALVAFEAVAIPNSGTLKLIAADAASYSISAALDALDTEKAPLASPALSGTPTAPTTAAGTNTTQVATTAFVAAQAGAASGYRNNTISAIGDSITAWDAVVTAVNTNSDLKRNHVCQMIAASGGVLSRGQFAATSGYTLSQIRSTHVPTIVALSPLPGACVVLAGTNDMTAGYNGATSIATLNGIWDDLIAGGVKPIACTLPPRTDTASYNDNVVDFNSRIRAEARRRNLDLLDYYPQLVAPAGGWRSDYNSGSDGVHPSNIAHCILGRASWAAIGHRFPTTKPWLVADVDDPTDLLTGNGLFLVDTNGDGISDNVTNASGSNFAFARTAGSDGYTSQGVTADGDETGSAWLQLSTASGWSVGDVIEMSAVIEADSVTPADGTTNAEIYIGYNGVSGQFFSHFRATETGTYVMSLRHTVPASATLLKVVMTSTAMRGGTIKWRRVGVRNLTTTGVLGY